MRKSNWAVLVCLAATGLGGDGGIVDTSRSPHVNKRSVGLGAVRWTGGFWAERCALVAKVSLPAMWEVMQDSGNSANFVNFKIAAGLHAGKFHGNNWSDGDV